MPDRHGQEIGSYRLLDLLGKGGFAEVYLGEHLHLQGRQAALKFLSKIDTESINDFLEEARKISKLEHPHIVQVLDYGVQENTPYLVMSHAPGGSLRTHIPRGTRLPLATVLCYVQQVAQALQYVHDHKLIHRDVKPHNMLLGAKGDVLLSDFGIAVVARTTSFEASQGMVGTIAYMAPEQSKGYPCYASDQYALGIVVYEWLTGNCPFHGTFFEVLAQHSNANPRPLRDIVPELPPAVEQVVLKALAKKPQDRFPSVQDFASALEAACTPSKEKEEIARKPTGPLPDTQPLGNVLDEHKPAILKCVLHALLCWMVIVFFATLIYITDASIRNSVNIHSLLSSNDLIPYILLTLLSLWLLFLGVWKVYLAVSSWGMRVVIHKHGVTLIEQASSRSFRWEDVETTHKKRRLFFFPPNNDIISWLLAHISVHRTYTVRCYDRRRFVFRDPLDRIEELSDTIEAEVVRTKGMPHYFA